MPKIDLITPIKYNSLWPYNSYYDNIPIENISTRVDLVNIAVDQHEFILEASQGTAGSLANRLDQSIESDGDLRTDAIDEAEHAIGAHTDGEYDGIEYVRMLLEERDKLDLISDEATALTIQFPTVSSTVVFTDETVEFQDSETVTWTVTAPNIVTANLAFSETAAHEHHYDLTPVHSNLSTPDYTNYKSTSVATPYIDGSLRVYVNGIRLSESDEVYVFDADDGPSGTWTLTSYTSDYANGTFALNRALSSSDIIRIDFDLSFI